MNKLLEKIREQRKYFIRTADGKKIITNSILFKSLEDEIRVEQEKVGKENKKLIIAECKKRGILIPNFRNESS